MAFSAIVVVVVGAALVSSQPDGRDDGRGYHTAAFGHYVRGEPDAIAHARELWQRGCDAGDATSCDWQAILTLGTSHEPRAILRARATLELACSDGDAFACHEVGFMHWGGRHGLVEDRGLADALYFEPACRDAGLCLGHGAVLLRGHDGAAPDVDAARALFEEHCARGDVGSCFGLGVVHDEAGEHELARALFEHTCAAGEARGCRARGHQIAAAAAMCMDPIEAGPGSDDEAAAWLARACRMGSVNGCAEVAELQ